MLDALLLAGYCAVCDASIDAARRENARRHALMHWRWQLRMAGWWHRRTTAQVEEAAVGTGP